MKKQVIHWWVMIWGKTRCGRTRVKDYTPDQKKATCQQCLLND